MPLVDAITFDFWNTLMREPEADLRDARTAAWLGLLEGAGFAIERAQMDAVFDAAWQEFVRAWRDNDGQFDAARTAEFCLGRLGLEVPHDLKGELVRAITEPEGRDIDPAPNVAAALEACRAAGLRVGIICDVGLTPSTELRGALDKHGLLKHFDHWSFSDEVGVYKPAAAIFDHAQAGLGSPPPERIAHIGDLRRTDVAGARAAGWMPLRYAGVFDDRSDAPDADHVVHDHAELAALLRLD